MAQLLSVGHGADDRGRLRARLLEAGAQVLVDVRRSPGSRRNPDVQRDALARWLPAAGIDYRWEERLGGRRRLPEGRPVTDAWWTVGQFAAYAAHTRTPSFRQALQELLATASGATTAIMCSEYLWWRCHRRLIADVCILAHGVPVTHLMPDGRPAAHRPAEGAVVADDGQVYWPGSRGGHPTAAGDPVESL